MLPDAITENNPASAVLTVSALNQQVARLLERSIPLTWVAGEVSNFTRAASGHWYFTLKDAHAQVRAVMFKSRTLATGFIPREGEQVEVRALVTLYAPRGDYQLSVEGMRRAGLGNLFEAFLQLKQKLTQEGLFSGERKQELPPYPGCIGIVTSPQAAALRDILTTLQRRAPHVRLILYPTPVQGSGSAASISKMIELAGVRAECDVLIVARGGGSIEDLWSFNDERVARSVAACPIPVITGIGHETDFTIADFAADLRAPTPTAAAEIAVTPRTDLMQLLNSAGKKMRHAVHQRMDTHAQTLDHLTRRLISPIAYVKHERLKLNSNLLRLRHAKTMTLQQSAMQFQQLKQQFIALHPDTSPAKNHLQHLARRLRQSAHRQVNQQKQLVHNLCGQLELLNPRRTLERGYAILRDEHNVIIKTPGQLCTQTHVTVTLAEGDVGLEISDVRRLLT